ncbi:MAG TPA: thioredoxin domain-containing protein [Allocoleopsis sp.]
MVLVVNQSTFNQEVLKSSTPVLVNFWAPWCGVCRLVSPILSDLQGKWGDQVKVVSINADDNLKLANLYRLTNLPTVLLFDRGELCYRFDHFRNREDLRATATNLQTALEVITANYSYSASL